MKELRLLASEDYKQLMFVDDNFTLNKKRVIELCHMIRKEKLSLEWISEGRVDQCSYSMLREMVKSGCRMMYFGIESGTQKVLDYFNKTITPDQSRRAIRKARKAGVDLIVGSFIVGAPGETKKDIEKTLSFSQKLHLDVPQINILGTFPGTPIWDELKAKGVLNEDKYWETGVGVAMISPDTVPLIEIKRMISEYYDAYLKRPRYLMEQILLTLRSSYRLNVVLSNLARIGEISDSVSSFLSR